jgi:hypothetical protein
MSLWSFDAILHLLKNPILFQIVMQQVQIAQPQMQPQYAQILMPNGQLQQVQVVQPQQMFNNIGGKELIF